MTEVVDASERLPRSEQLCPDSCEHPTVHEVRSGGYACTECSLWKPDPGSF